MYIHEILWRRVRIRNSFLHKTEKYSKTTIVEQKKNVEVY